jgi:bacteriophage N4 adsorption protein B
MGDSGGVMSYAASILVTCDFVLRELALFAAAGFLLLGISDLAVDLIYLGLRVKRLIAGSGHEQWAATPPAAAQPGRLAIFVPAWDESAVIGPMLSHATRAFGQQDYVFFVGCYPNDPATIAAVAGLGHDRIRLVVGPVGIMQVSPKSL